MVKKFRGFVLLTVLFFLQILSLSSLAELMAMRLQLKQEEIWGQRTRALRMAKQELGKIINASFLHCTIPVTPATQLAQQSLTAWEQIACRYNKDNVTYYYLRELLLLDSCALIDNQVRTVAFYRISLLAILNQSINIRLQAIYTLPLATISVCSLKPHTVPLGQLIQREIT